MHVILLIYITKTQQNINYVSINDTCTCMSGAYMHEKKLPSNFSWAHGMYNYTFLMY